MPSLYKFKLDLILLLIILFLKGYQIQRGIEKNNKYYYFKYILYKCIEY